jgi:hypothetical protein
VSELYFRARYLSSPPSSFFVPHVFVILSFEELMFSLKIPLLLLPVPLLNFEPPSASIYFLLLVEQPPPPRARDQLFPLDEKASSKSTGCAVRQIEDLERSFFGL